MGGSWDETTSTRDWRRGPDRMEPVGLFGLLNGEYQSLSYENSRA